MAPALPVGEAFFPLDEQLGLVSGGGTPRVEETLVRLAGWMPFEQARDLLQDPLGLQVSKATAGRAKCRMERSGCEGWSTTTVRRPCASWILAMPLNTSMRSGRRRRQQEGDCPPPGWTECCTGSNTRGLKECSSI